MALYNYSLQISVVWKIFTVSKFHTINIYCLLLSLIFFLRINIFLEQITLFATNIQALLKHCSLLQTKNQAYHKQKINRYYLQIQCISYFLFFPFHSFLVTTLVQTACISLLPSHVPQ